MVNFVEKATLMLNDQSSAKINKINAALRTLRKEAQATQKALANFKMPDLKGNVDKRIRDVTRSLRQYNKEAGKIPKNVNINIRAKGLDARQLRGMAAALAQYKSASRGIKDIIGAGSGKMNFANLDSLVIKLVRVARSANMAAIALGKMKANIPNNNIRIPNANRPGRGPGPQNGLLGLNIQPLRSLFRSFIVDLGHALANSIKSAIAEGTKGFDVAANKFEQQRLTPDQKQAFSDQAFASSRTNPLIRADQRQDMYAEISTNFKDPMDALKFDKTLDRAVTVAVQQGQTAEQAIDGIATLFRGLGQAGYLTGADGKMDPRVLKYIDAYTAAKVSEGAQINFKDAFQVLKYAKTSAQTMSPEQFFFMLLQAADVGASTAGVQANMTQKTLAGETTKKALAAQEDAGLRGPSSAVESGRVGNKITYTITEGKVVDEELFRENTQQWFQKYIIGPGGFLEKKGLNVASSTPAQIISALDPLSGNRNADDFIAKTVLQFTENMQKYEKYFKQPRSTEELYGISEQSSYVQLTETSNLMITAFGLVTDKLEGFVIPALDAVGGAAQRVIDILQGKTNAEVQDYALLGVAGAGAVGAGKLATGLLGFGLPAAAAALNTSAGLLSQAALQLMGKGAAAGAANAGNTAGAGALAWLSRLAGIASLGMLRGSDQNNAYTNMTPEQRAKARSSSGNAAAGFTAIYDLSPKMQEMSVKLSQTTNQIAALEAQIAQGKAAGYSNSSDYMMSRTLDLNTLQGTASQLTMDLSTGTETIRAAFETGTTQISQASATFGSTAAEQLMGIASSFGSAAGEAMRTAMGALNLNVNQSTAPIPNTGTNTNLATGG